MNTRTTLNCFALITALVVAGFLLESIFAGLARGLTPSGLDQILPLSSLPRFAQNFLEGKQGATPENAASGTSQRKRNAPVKQTATVYLQSGSVVSGEIVSEEPGWIILNLEGSQVGFHASEIKRIQKEETN